LTVKKRSQNLDLFMSAILFYFLSGMNKCSPYL
jgi:hypothetical protein